VEENQGMWTQEAEEAWSRTIVQRARRRNAEAQGKLQAGGVFLGTAWPDTRVTEFEPRTSP